MSSIKQGSITFYNPKKAFGYVQVEGESVYFHLNRWRGQGKPAVDLAVEVVTEPSTVKEGQKQARHIGVATGLYTCPHCGDATLFRGLCGVCYIKVKDRHGILCDMLPSGALAQGYDHFAVLLNPVGQSFRHGLMTAVKRLPNPSTLFEGAKRTHKGAEFTYEFVVREGHWQCVNQPAERCTIDLLNDHYLVIAFAMSQIWGIEWLGDDLSQEAALLARQKWGDHE